MSFVRLLPCLCVSYQIEQFCQFCHLIQCVWFLENRFFGRLPARALGDLFVLGRSDSDFGACSSNFVARMLARVWGVGPYSSVVPDCKSGVLVAMGRGPGSQGTMTLSSSFSDVPLPQCHCCVPSAYHWAPSIDWTSSTWCLTSSSSNKSVGIWVSIFKMTYSLPLQGIDIHYNFVSRVPLLPLGSQ